MDREAILREDAEQQLRREADLRRFLYRDVEALIEGPFLAHSLLVDGVPVALRTLLPEEVRRFNARVHHLYREGDVLRWSIAASTWMVNGYEVPPNDPNASWHLYQEWAQHLPASLAEVMGASIAGLHNRVSRAIRLTEAYCYEQYSRGMWRMLGRPQSGLENANSVRRLWVAYNLTADQDRVNERQWGHTRAVVGSLTNKGAKHITKELEKVEERETSRQQRVIEEAVNWVIQGEETEQVPVTITVGGREIEVPRIHAAQSTEDLEEEMRRVFAGEEDWHDYLVNQYQKNVKQNVLQKRQERHDQIMEARRRADEAEEKGTAPMVGYTPEQLAELRPDVSGQRTTASLPASAQSNFMFDRYFNPTLRPGVLTPALQVEDPSSAEAERFGHAEESAGVGGEPKPTLQERIASRQTKVGEP